MATSMATALWNILADRNLGLFIKAGRTLTTQFSTRTALLPRDRSRCAKCKATFTLRRWRRPDWLSSSAMMHGRVICRSKPKPSSNDLKESAAIVLAGLLDASLFFDLHRLPELFCGFPRRPGEAPTLYPVACAPQSWASAAVFLLLEACLGLSVSASERRLTFSKPVLPRFLQQVTIRGLKVADGLADLLLTRHDEGDVGVTVLRREGALDIVVLK